MAATQTLRACAVCRYMMCARPICIYAFTFFSVEIHENTEEKKTEIVQQKQCT